MVQRQRSGRSSSTLAFCTTCGLWLRKCTHLSPDEKPPGSVPGDERSVSGWQWANSVNPSPDDGRAPTSVPNGTSCPGWVKR